MSIVEAASLLCAGFVAGRGLDFFQGPIHAWLMDRKIDKNVKQRAKAAA